MTLKADLTKCQQVFELQKEACNNKFASLEKTIEATTDTNKFITETVIELKSSVSAIKNELVWVKRLILLLATVVGISSPTFASVLVPILRQIIK